MVDSPRNRAANILGGYERLFELEAAGLVIMDRATRRARHERYRSASLLLRKIGDLVSEFFPTPPKSTQERRAMNLPLYAPKTLPAQELYEVTSVFALLGDEAFVREALLEHLRTRAPFMLSCGGAAETTGTQK